MTRASSSDTAFHRIVARLLRLAAAFAALVAAIPATSWAQWTTGENGAISYSGGNVGIGNSNPTAPLTLPSVTNPAVGVIDFPYLGAMKHSIFTQTYGGIPGNNWLEFRIWNGNVSTPSQATPLHLDGAGNVGIGTTSPGGPLHVVGNASSFYRGVGTVAIDTGNAGGAAGHVFEESNGNATLLTQYANTFSIWRHSGTGSFVAADQKLSIDASGNVGIGTTSPQHKLSVNGIIGVKEVIVTNTGWADHVLQPGYALQPLDEIAAYIQANHRLPEIPSAAEVQEKGVNLAEMQVKLLAKVEELTLHMIQADKRNSRLEEQNRELRERIEFLENGAGSKK